MSWGAIGWLGNACFFTRFLVQWLASERARRSVAPAAFWLLSSMGAACIALYSLERGEGALAAGALVNGVIAIANLSLRRRRSPAVLVVGLTLAAGVLLAATRSQARADGWDPSTAWGLVALVGQGLWSARFVLQWWLAERAGRSYFSRSFWWISLAGNALLLAYAVHLGDPVYIAGFALGPLVQLRNLALSSGKGAGPSTASSASPSGLRRAWRRAPGVVRPENG